MLKKPFYSILLLVLAMSQAYAQQRPLKQPMFKDLEVTNAITKSVQDTTYKFHVEAVRNTDNAPDISRYYYWFQDGEIRQTQGSYSGKLLHGPYEKFDRTGYLLMQGTFNHGVKDGSWLTWHKNNNIAQQYLWKNGHRQGKFSEYYNSGALRKTGTFKKDRLNGTVTHFKNDGSILMEEKYSNGKIIKPKEKKVRAKKNKNKKDSAQIQQQLPAQISNQPNPKVDQKINKREQRRNKKDSAKVASPKVASPKVTMPEKQKKVKAKKDETIQNVPPTQNGNFDPARDLEGTDQPNTNQIPPPVENVPPEVMPGLEKKNSTDPSLEPPKR